MSRFGVKRLHKPLWMPGCENSICPAFVAMGWGCQRGESTAQNLPLRTNLHVGVQSSPHTACEDTAVVQQGRARVVAVHEANGIR